MKNIFPLIVVILTVCSVNAQPYGHINYGNLLESLPEVSEANDELLAFQDSIGKALEQASITLQNRIKESQTRYKAGELTKREADQINASLNNEQTKLTQRQIAAEKAVVAKRKAMIEPIVERVNKAIKEVGKEMGYMMIFDESTGVLLFDQPTDDLTTIIADIIKSQ